VPQPPWTRLRDTPLRFTTLFDLPPAGTAPASLSSLLALLVEQFTYRFPELILPLLGEIVKPQFERFGAFADDFGLICPAVQ
jgi:hypothetical protein